MREINKTIQTNVDPASPPPPMKFSEQVKFSKKKTELKGGGELLLHFEVLSKKTYDLFKEEGSSGGTLPAAKTLHICQTGVAIDHPQTSLVQEGACPGWPLMSQASSGLGGGERVEIQPGMKVLKPLLQRGHQGTAWTCSPLRSQY